MASDVEKYRKRLIEERDQLGQELGKIMENTGPVTDDLQITAANAPVIAEAKEIEARVKGIKSDQLDKVNAALQAVADGTYGTCIKCGKQIDPRRLEAEPAALACVDCLPAEEVNVATPQL